MREIRTAMSYYGGKGNVVKYYPEPKHKNIIEPFAGGAAYSLLYYNHDITLCEKNINVYNMWDYIQNGDDDYKYLPEVVSPGEKISDIVCIDNIHSGLLWLLRAACNMGTAGSNKKNNTITPFGAIHWNLQIRKIEYWKHKIQHWNIKHGSYTSLKNSNATWFIDPPYINTGYKYAESNIDYTLLAKWCIERKGFSIVCENKNANWLSFQEKINFNKNTFKSTFVKSNSKEVYCTIIN